MSKRKHLTEFGLHSYADALAVLQQAQLKNIQLQNFDPHIYLITRCPRISLDPNLFFVDEFSFKGVFNIQRENIIESVSFEVPNDYKIKKITLESKYPYTELKFINAEDSSVILHTHTATLMAISIPNAHKYLNLEVLYVGQSYGRKKRTNATDRLKNHKTLQNIYSEAIRNSPDQEIWLVLSHFTPLIISSTAAIDIEPLSIDKDKAHIDNFLDNRISEQQFINFTEAALIQYFQPEYNKIYKDIFPNPAHSTYQHCYDVDLNLVSFELQTEIIMRQLWSSHAVANWTHKKKFPLHNIKDRKEMFDIL